MMYLNLISLFNAYRNEWLIYYYAFAYSFLSLRWVCSLMMKAIWYYIYKQLTSSIIIK